MKKNNLRRLIGFVAIAVAMAAPIQARTKKGDKYIKEGQSYEARKQWDEAVDLYEKALASDPRDPGYMMYVKRGRFQASQIHVDAGQKLREQGKLEEALKEFQTGILRDPGSAIALQEWRRTTEMVEAEKNGKKLEGAERGVTPAERARKEMDERAASILPPPELKPISQLPATLKINNQPPKVLYETVGKLAGINVVFDPQFQSQSQGKGFNLDLNNASLDQALDYLAILTKTFWKPISSNTIFVTEDNITKRRDYEDNVVKVFYVQNATSVQEFQEIATAVRSLTEIRRVFTYNAQRAILMRGTPDQIALAEKLIHDLDKPKAEVIVDVIVMEANSSKTRTLAAQLSSTGLNLPIGFTPRSSISQTTSTTGTTSTTSTSTTSSSSTVVNLTNLKRISMADFSTTLPGALLNLVMSDRETRVLQSPQVRASDGQKVTLRIGNKIPYATGSFNSGIGSVAGMAYANTQFNFAEVGVNVDLTPTVHGKDEVTLKVAIEVSNVSDHVTIGGVEQPIIGQRKSETEIRLREGEVNILGGLSQDQNTRSLNGVPGLVNIPILGRLLGGEATDKERGDLLIALVPHIVRTPSLTDVDVKGVLSGSDQVVRVSYAPRASAPAPAPGPAQNQPAAAAPPPTPAPAVVTPPPPTAQPSIPGVPSAAPAAGPRLIFMPGRAQTQLGGQLNLTLQGELMQDLFTASPIRLKWDPKVLRLNEITPGELLSRDNQRITSAKDIRNDSGEAWITMNRLPGAGGVNGSGGLATLSFTAIGKGATVVVVSEFGLRNAQLQPIAVTAPAVEVTVQ
ncbi:MAG: tetratricopeptide repeat protein [Acidobacteria bacterium]|nr:tetratricopeptide repeat protein [Acidobacteriota bacterium]